MSSVQPVTGSEAEHSSLSNDRIVATLNELIEASKDGEKGLAMAAKDAQDPELAGVLGDGGKVNGAAAAELQDQVRLLGSTTEQDGSMNAAVHRSWTSLLSKMNARDDKAILEECEQAEGYVRGRYAEALELTLPGPIRSVIERHHQAIVEAHYRVLDLRNRFRDRDARALRAND